MPISKETQFIKSYFDCKERDRLLSTITPNWSEENTLNHLKIVDVPKDAKFVCEIGAGIGRLLREISKKGKDCIGFDASESMVKESLNYLNGYKAIIKLCDGKGKIDYASDIFDFTFSIITFQHIPNTETVMEYISEMIRITKPCGEIMFQVLSKEMNRGFLWTYHNLDDIHHFLEDKTKTIKMEESGVWTIFRCKK